MADEDTETTEPEMIPALEPHRSSLIPRPKPAIDPDAESAEPVEPEQEEVQAAASRRPSKGRLPSLTVKVGGKGGREIKPRRRPSPAVRRGK